MARKKIIIISATAVLIIVIYFPSLSKLQQLKEENKTLMREIAELKETNEMLRNEIHKLETDPTYVEGVAREKLKKARKGEIIYRTE